MLPTAYGAGGSPPAPRPHCYTCFKPRVACICDAVALVDNRTGVTVLQHPRERFHPLGTVRIARLGLRRVRIVSCPPWEDCAAVGASLPAGSALLYPSATARDLAALPRGQHPRHLVAIDGTWFLARKVYAAHAWLHALPHVALAPVGQSRYGSLRREPRPNYLATLEALVDALRILEPDTLGFDGLLAAFDTMIDRQAAFIAPR